MAEKRRGLGRGLGALIPNSTKPASEQKEVSSTQKGGSTSPSAAAGKKQAAGMGRQETGTVQKKTTEQQSSPSLAKLPAPKKSSSVRGGLGRKHILDQEVLPVPTDQKMEEAPHNTQEKEKGTKAQSAIKDKISAAAADLADKKAAADTTAAGEKAPAAEDKTASAPHSSGEKSASEHDLFDELPAESERPVPSQAVSQESAPTEETPQPAADTKDVSRETLKKKQRLDMGQALRNTTLTRRPVDFFFGEEVKTPSSSEDLVPVPGAQFAILNISDIHPNRKQPRVDFDEHDMDELVHSVKEIGVLQPIVVRPSREKGHEKYELVMGERRWRATQRAGLPTIPAIVRDTQDNDLLRDALLENLHRSQLNPIEEAAAYQQLMEEFGTTQDQLAKRIGRSRPQISNTIRLLKLPALVQRRVAAGVLSAGHARALLMLTDQAQIETLAQKIVNEGLSVRAVEELVAAASGAEDKKQRKEPRPQKHRERLDYIADAFADKLDTSVKISLGARKGKMTIEFANVDDLNRIIKTLDTNFEN